MRRIQTQAEIDKKAKRNHIVIGLVMISILVLSSLGFALISSDRDDDEKNSEINELGYNFFNDNGIWVTNLNGEFFTFKYLPSEVLDVEMNLSTNLGYYSEKPLYFVNTNYEEKSEILNNIDRYILRYQDACINSEDCEGDIPLKDCSNNLIIFEEIEENKTSVYQDRNCVYIVGDKMKGTDAFLYNVLGIN